jgi:hypothetical protein
MDTAAERADIERQERGPTCRRCGNKTWRVEGRPKSRLRWLLETAIAAPDVLIFQGESGGWPSKVAELWTCEQCGRQVRQ